MINCNESCIHEEEGICTLDHIISFSCEAISICPYYKNKNADKSYINNNINNFY